MSHPGTVYLLHFDRRIAGHAGHYLGWAKNLTARLREHASGRGSRLMAAVVAEGIGWRVARTWEGDRHLEKALKKQREGTKLCPLCKAERHHRQMAAQRKRRTARREARKENRAL